MEKREVSGNDKKLIYDTNHTTKGIEYLLQTQFSIPIPVQCATVSDLTIHRLKRRRSTTLGCTDKD